MAHRGIMLDRILFIKKGANSLYFYFLTSINKYRGELNMPEFRHINGHIEVYIDDIFLFSSDTIEEAESELMSQMVSR